MSANRYVVQWTRRLTGETGYAPGEITNTGFTVVPALAEATPVTFTQATGIADRIRSSVATHASIRLTPSA